MRLPFRIFPFCKFTPDRGPGPSSGRGAPGEGRGCSTRGVNFLLLEFWGDGVVDEGDVGLVFLHGEEL